MQDTPEKQTAVAVRDVEIVDPSNPLNQLIDEGGPRCSAPRADGSPCRMTVSLGRRCILHSSTPEERTALARKGAAASNALQHAGDLPQEQEEEALSTAPQVRRYVTSTMRGVRAGRISTAVGKTVAQLASVALRAIEADIAARLEELEKLAEQHANLNVTIRRRR